MPNSLQNAAIVILGGSSGIGLATAKAAIGEGAVVTITGRSPERLDVARAELDDGANAVLLDAADEAGTRTFLESMPKLDHLFITAGALVADTHLEAPSAELRVALNTRFWGAFYAAKYAAPKMSDGSSITFMSGTAGRRPLPGAAVASASCGAVDTFARALAMDLAPIRVNTITPGYIDTPLFDDLLGDQREVTLTDVAASLPMKRIGHPDEVAHAIMFLMQNGYVTGINLAVDGGCLLV